MSLEEDTKAERALLGLILRDPRNLGPALALGLSAADFGEPEMGAIYRAILVEEAAERPFDLAAMAVILPSAGLMTLLALPEDAPVGADPAYFIREIKAAAWCRLAIGKLALVHGDLLVRRPYELLTRLQAEVAELGDLAHEKPSDEISIASQLSAQCLEDLDRRISARRNGKAPGITTGFKLLDLVLGGFYPGGLYTLAARKKVGKTTCAMNIMLAAAQSGASSAYFTVEMSAREIADKALVRLSGVDYSRYINGNLTNFEMESLSDADDVFSGLPISIREIKPRLLEKVLFDLRRLKRTRGLQLAVIDYAQQLVTERRFANPQMEISHITSELKSAAMDLGIAILLIAQLNRTAEEGEPTSSQIKGSGSFEQDSDAIMLLWRETEDGSHILDVPDNRRGKPGRIRLVSDLAKQKFEEAK